MPLIMFYEAMISNWLLLQGNSTSIAIVPATACNNPPSSAGMAKCVTLTTSRFANSCKCEINVLKLR